MKHGDDKTIKDKFKLGVDLAGGVNLVYQIQTENDENGDEVTMTDATMQGLLNALGRRLNPSGALDLILRPYGNNDHVEIVVPEATAAEIAHIKEIITNTGALQFLIQVGTNDDDHQVVRDAVEESFTTTYNTRLVKNAQGETIGRWVKVGTEIKPGSSEVEFAYNASSVSSIKRVYYSDENGIEVELSLIHI